jgi:hypothetical protein
MGAAEMPVARWGIDWTRAHLASGSGLARAGVLAIAAIGTLVYLDSGLWFDLAYWVLGRLARERVGRGTRIALSVGFAGLVFAALATSGTPAAPGPRSSPEQAAAGSPSGAGGTPGVVPEASSTRPANAATPAASETLAVLDADDETIKSAAPRGSFSPGATGMLIAGTAAARLPGEPDPRLTPGALNPAVSQATIGTTICVSGWTATIRPPSSYTSALKVQQIAQYGYGDTSTADYEEDHLISLELGGAPTDPRNLWPEPYASSLADGRPTGAHVKDGYETRLKNEVCAGTIALAQAQADIGVHWVHAYYGIALSSGPAAIQTAAGTTGPTTGASSFGVAFVTLPNPAHPGSKAYLAARTSAGATCAIKVTWPSGTVSKASGLQTTPAADADGLVSWTWNVGSSTKPGTARVTVSCTLGSGSASAQGTFPVE